MISLPPLKRGGNASRLTQSGSGRTRVKVRLGPELFTVSGCGLCVVLYAAAVLADLAVTLSWVLAFFCAFIRFCPPHRLTFPLFLFI